MSRLYKIGDVAKRTGIGIERLRAWERRYDLIPPERTSSGTRFYNEEQVDQLSKIKSLVDRGHSISELAKLTPNQVNQRLDAAFPQTSLDVVLVGTALILEERQYLDIKKAEVIATWPSIETFRQHLTDIPVCDVIAISIGSLNPKTVDWICKIRAKTQTPVLCVYSLSTKDALELALEHDIALLCKAKAGWSEIESLCRELLIESSQRTKYATRLFSNDELAHIAEVIKPNEPTQPNYLVNLVLDAHAYEEHLEVTTKEEGIDTTLLASVRNGRRQLEEALDAHVAANGLLAR